MSFGIAFEGCACKGAFHVGVAEWMQEHGYEPVDALEQLGADRLIGCVTGSEGTLRGGFLRERVFDVPAACRILRPIEPLQLDTWELDARRIRDAIALGRRSAEVFFEANDAWLRGEPTVGR